jgi:integrase/recombinase XerD
MRLSTAIERYISWKQAHGIRCVRSKWAFRKLLRDVGDVEIESIGPAEISAHLENSKMAPDTWWRTYQMLRAFFQFWISRQRLSSLPMPRPRAASPPPFRPFIFTIDQLRFLMAEAGRLQMNRNRKLDPLTFQTMIALMYGTGALIHEAIDLRTSDVEVENKSLTLRRLGGARKRTLPIGISMACRLENYDRVVRARRCGSPFFFVNRIGQPIPRMTLIHNFRRVCSRLGITQDHGISQTPGLHDIRHTFAVHCLNGWLEKGKDARQMVPALSGYMGHVMPISTEQYLKLVPARFSKHLRQLTGSPCDARRCGEKHLFSGQ